MRLPAFTAVCLMCACTSQQETPMPIAEAQQHNPLLQEGQLGKVEKKAASVEKVARVDQPKARGDAQKEVASSGVLNALGGTGGIGDLSGAPGIGGLGTKGMGSGGGGALMGKGTVVVGAYGHGGFGPMGVRGDLDSNSESYGEYGVNAWTDTTKDHLSTFAADVDTASYAVARRKILEGTLPPKSSVRVEEFLNYFRYTYPQPEPGAPLSVTMDAAPSPFSPGKHLVRVGVQGKRLAISERKAAHLTFLVDVSGSMQSQDKLPLAKRALRMLVDNLRDGDTVSLVTYAGGVRLVLAPTGMEKKAVIHQAIEDLHAGGSTAMASGIQLAYQQATKQLDGNSISRVIILSDGDANVGATSQADILKLIAGYVKEGVTVTTVGFGMGNYKDDLMEQFANKGNGNHYYVDSLFEAKRIFQTELGGTLEVIAQDVKLQVDFDPAQVKRYRLVGYENRDIADADFRNDKVDAGEIGSGHTVTALYEVELAPGAGEKLCTVRVRAKKPRGTEAAETAFPFQAAALASRFDGASRDFRFATAVMGAAEMFRLSEHARGWNYDLLVEIAKSAAGADAERAEFVSLLEHARPVVKAVATR